MAVCYKDKQNILSYNFQTSKSHGQFDNLNLNRNNFSCPDSLNLQSFKRFSPFRNTFKIDHGNFFDGRKEEWKGKNQWSKNDPKMFVSHYRNDYSKKNETKWDKENLSTTTNKSTLSLNIAAYEEEKSFE
uniref:Uncharacterized protein n=1 Tax=Panagrolaimus sp. PS1159 TaxID=55785 RepID=A0AC35F3P3_9BILA